MVCHEMAFLPPPSSDHHQYFLHHPQLLNHQEFHGHDPSLTMMNHHQHHNQMTSPVVSGHGGAGDVDHDDLSDDGSQLVLGEKKKRLSLEQVKTLEKNFELGNKLEPERKIQLAKALGLQPRQVAIWFQNRRARWKTKQLEKDYNVLKRQFEALRSDNESLLSLNKKLHAELLAVKTGAENATNPTTSPQEGVEFGAINLNTTTTTKSYCNWSNNGSEISSDINLGMSTTPQQQSHPNEESPSNNKLHYPATHFLPTSLTDLLTSSSSNPKSSDHPHQQIQDDTFCSLFSGHGTSGGASGGVGDQPPFWAWAPQDQHHLH